ncbi:6168_t:CDS:2 [Entrophospora sp. SA101]|nr:6168_t:CDS:2 [Entrophospora sp. SA101]
MSVPSTPSTPSTPSSNNSDPISHICNIFDPNKIFHESIWKDLIGPILIVSSVGNTCLEEDPFLRNAFVDDEINKETDDSQYDIRKDKTKKNDDDDKVKTLSLLKIPIHVAVAIEQKLVTDKSTEDESSFISQLFNDNYIENLSGFMSSGLDILDLKNGSSSRHVLPTDDTISMGPIRSFHIDSWKILLGSNVLQMCDIGSLKKINNLSAGTFGIWYYCQL